MTKFWPIAGLIVLTVVLTRSLLPRTVHTPAPPPVFVATHDTIRDTLRIPVPKSLPPQTLTIHETIHETTYVNVGAAPAERTNIWPVLSVDVGKKVGDTTTINTFDLRSGMGATSKIYTAGPLLGVWAGSSPTPQYLFGPPPEPYRVSFWTKVKWGGIGYGSCTVVSGLAKILHP